MSTPQRHDDHREITGPRWSSAVICPRIAAYQALGVPASDALGDALAGRFLRGYSWGKIVADDVFYARKQGGKRTRREVRVRWPRRHPIGTGHADMYLPEERRMLEVLSTVNPEHLPPNKVLQVAGYALNHRHATSAAVVVVDVQTGADRTYPIDLDAAEPRVRAIEDAVWSAAAGGPLPERIAAAPWVYPCAECSYRTVCWQGWEPEPVSAVAGADLLFTMLAEAQDNVKRAEQAVEDAKLERAELVERARPLLPAGVPQEAGGVRVLRSQVRGRRGLSLANIETAGHTLPRKLRPFVNESAGHEQVRITRRDDA